MWDTCFEQSELPIEDKLIQVNLGIKDHPQTYLRQ